VRRPAAKQPATREDRAGLGGKSERPIVPKKPGNAGGGKGPWFKSKARRSKGKEIGVSLITPESVWQLQEALQAKAKSEPACRFHRLYDKLYRKDVLLHAWRCCRANGGAPGVDGMTFQQIEQGGVKFPGIHHRPVLLAQGRPGLYRHAPLYLHRVFGLLRLAPTTGNRSCAKA